MYKTCVVLQARSPELLHVPSSVQLIGQTGASASEQAQTDLLLPTELFLLCCIDPLDFIKWNVTFKL